MGGNGGIKVRATDFLGKVDALFAVVSGRNQTSYQIRLGITPEISRSQPLGLIVQLKRWAIAVLPDHHCRDPGPITVLRVLQTFDPHLDLRSSDFRLNCYVPNGSMARRHLDWESRAG